MPKWVGASSSDLPWGTLGPLAPWHWPYGLPRFHQPCCKLFDGGRHCDCAASSSDDDDAGWGRP